MGGIVGGWIGVILGGTIRHTVGGHMGGKSMLLLHSGCITPLTHRQTHAAFALLALTDAPTSAAYNKNFRMVSSLWRTLQRIPLIVRFANYTRGNVPHCEDAVYHPAMTALKWFTAALVAMLALPEKENRAARPGGQDGRGFLSPARRPPSTPGARGCRAGRGWGGRRPPP